jgi:small subunit ribosomal protein S18
VRRGGKPKVCVFCTDKTTWVDYKDVNVLRRFMSDRGKIKARSASGCCAQHQRDMALAIKTARELALLPYVQRTVSDGRGRGGRGPGRGGRRDDGEAPRAAAPAEADEAGSTDAIDGAEAPEDASVDTAEEI